MSVAIARKVGKRCAFVMRGARFAKAGSCRARRGFRAKGRSKFSLSLRVKLPKGRYIVSVQAADRAGNLSRRTSRSVTLR